MMENNELIVFPSSSQYEALARYSISREFPRSILSAKLYLAPLMRPQKCRDIPVSLEGTTEVPGTTSSEPLLPF